MYGSQQKVAPPGLGRRGACSLPANPSVPGLIERLEENRGPLKLPGGLHLIVQIPSYQSSAQVAEYSG